MRIRDDRGEILLRLARQLVLRAACPSLCLHGPPVRSEARPTQYGGHPNASRGELRATSSRRNRASPPLCRRPCSCRRRWRARRLGVWGASAPAAQPGFARRAQQSRQTGVPRRRGIPPGAPIPRVETASYLLYAVVHATADAVLAGRAASAGPRRVLRSPEATWHRPGRRPAAQTPRRVTGDRSDDRPRGRAGPHQPAARAHPCDLLSQYVHRGDGPHHAMAIIRNVFTDDAAAALLAAIARTVWARRTAAVAAIRLMWTASRHKGERDPLTGEAQGTYVQPRPPSDVRRSPDGVSIRAVPSPCTAIADGGPACRRSRAYQLRPLSRVTRYCPSPP